MASFPRPLLLHRVVIMVMVMSVMNDHDLFGAGTNNADRVSRRKANQSILDWITGEVSGLKRQLGPSDRERLDSQP